MQNKKRIMFLSVFPGATNVSNYGGGEHFAAEFIKEIHQRGWEVTIVCPPSSPFWRDEKLKKYLKGIIALDLSVKVSQSFRFLWMMVQWNILAVRFGRCVIYGNGFETLKWMAAVRWIKGIKTICHLHESDCRPYYSERARYLCRFINLFIAISNSVRNEFIKGARLQGNRIVRIYNGIPLASKTESGWNDTFNVRNELGISSSTPLVVMAARTDPLKGHEVLVRSVPTILASVPEARIVVVGVQAHTKIEEDICQNIDRLISAENIAHAVHLLPHRTDVRKIMRSADVVVVPSTAEGFGRTAIEAMAESVAVVASRVGGLAEIIDSESNGILVTPGDSEELAHAVVRLLRYPTERKIIANEGHKLVVTKFSTNVMVDQIEHELRLLIKGYP